MTEPPNSHASLRARVADLFEPSPPVYWIDFVTHAALGWTAFVLALRLGGWAGAALVPLAALALYRAVIFTHELAHVRRGKLPGFSAAWNAVCGVPVLAPSFFYDGVHQAHHFRQHYGTPQDGEYLAFGHPPRRLIVIYLVSHLVIPALAILRFGVIAPAGWLWPPLRRTVLERMSSLSIDPRYVRKVPEHVPWSWRVQEAACALFVWLAGAALLAGWLPWRALAAWYATLVIILVLNAVRTLAAHRYANEAGSMTREEQLLDSVNIGGGSPLTPILAPVGLRYHALHHLFPTMPYHNLGTAHRRLMAKLPADAPYRSTVEPGFAAALANLWRRAGGRETPESRQAGVNVHS